MFKMPDMLSGLYIVSCEATEFLQNTDTEYYLLIANTHQLFLSKELYKTFFWPPSTRHLEINFKWEWESLKFLFPLDERLLNYLWGPGSPSNLWLSLSCVQLFWFLSPARLMEGLHFSTLWKLTWSGNVLWLMKCEDIR